MQQWREKFAESREIVFVYCGHLEMTVPVGWALNIDVLLLCCRTLDGDACCPHEASCPLQLLQVAIKLSPQ